MALGRGVGLGQGRQTQVPRIQVLAGSGVGPGGHHDGRGGTCRSALTHRSPEAAAWDVSAEVPPELYGNLPILQVGNELKTENTQFRPNRNLWGVRAGLPAHGGGGVGGAEGGRGWCAHAMDWWKSDRSFWVAWRNRMVAAWGLSDPSQEVLPA